MNGRTKSGMKRSLSAVERGTASLITFTHMLGALWQAVYTALREAEYRSTAFIPYWNVPLLRAVVPRQRRCTEALKVINSTLDGLIAKSQRLVRALVGAEDCPSQPCHQSSDCVHGPDFTFSIPLLLLPLFPLSPAALRP